MKYYKLLVETGFAGVTIEDDFEMPDDATEADIEHEARELMFNHIAFAHYEVDENGKKIETGED